MYHSTIKTFCGDSVPDIVTLSGDSATVYFYTNSADNNYRGFQMEYWADEGKWAFPFMFLSIRENRRVWFGLWCLTPL